MKQILSAISLGVGLSGAIVAPAVAYPVDCAIMLCLAGGWPASAECAHARAVFIRRITPWPIEPPLQIWNCPMRASARKSSTFERFFDVAAAAATPEQMISRTLETMQLRWMAGQADVDISNPAFDFVRSIRVFEISFQQRRGADDDCNILSAIHEGRYGSQGEYRRRRAEPASVPKASDLRPPPDCREYLHRSVFVEWRDVSGAYDHEEVHY
jgi:hypothetical protein